ncbi:MAG: MmcQ/YjbR family DNA-binding protein [Caulobacter sp.]|nr:MmcQ/YjbR family DNA-binding protein [Caulobacter sp.]
MPMTYDDIAAFALRLPGVEYGTAYGRPCLKAHGKFLTRLFEDGESLVCPGVPFEEREMLIEAEPAVFHFTDHFRNYPYVLIRLASAHPGTVEGLVLRQWRATAPKTVLKAWDESRATGAA